MYLNINNFLDVQSHTTDVVNQASLNVIVADSNSRIDSGMTSLVNGNLKLVTIN